MVAHGRSAITEINAAILLGMAAFLGCQTAAQRISSVPIPQPTANAHKDAPIEASHSNVQLTALHQTHEVDSALPFPQSGTTQLLTPAKTAEAESLAALEAFAIGNNPTLRRMRQEAAAEWAQTGYVSKLPDPTIGAMAFAPPMHFDPDRQLAEVQIMQMVPWLGRLRAEARRASLEALAAVNLYQAERLRVIGDLRAAWYRLYVLQKQVETIEADKAQLQSLLNTANARISAGAAQSGDVLMATLELSSLQEQLLNLHQQIASAKADLNRLVGRDSQTPITAAETIAAQLPAWNHEFLRQAAFNRQPELNAARLRTAATRWGIEVARLKRRPDLTFGLGWMIMDSPGVPEAGQDSWTLGVTASIPLWRQKYDAMHSEASREHYAAHATEDEVALELDALLADLWEQAVASQKTVELYETTILPQARQTFEADQASLINNTVTFDRVIRDYRTLLNLELGYHRALGQLATALARIRQAAGDDLVGDSNP
jgi:outer membrane protein TolC